MCANLKRTGFDGSVSFRRVIFWDSPY